MLRKSVLNLLLKSDYISEHVTYMNKIFCFRVSRNPSYNPGRDTKYSRTPIIRTNVKGDPDKQVSGQSQQVAKSGWPSAEPLSTVIMCLTHTFRRSSDILCCVVFVTASESQTSEKMSDPNHVSGFHSLYYPRDTSYVKIFLFFAYHGFAIPVLYPYIIVGFITDEYLPLAGHMITYICINSLVENSDICLRYRIYRCQTPISIVVNYIELAQQLHYTITLSSKLEIYISFFKLAFSIQDDFILVYSGH
ncbi:hypothetical protein AGLY_002403 [Aphis glycines]|uniref:Uncharacterized protein n=1 Tax=Aphis glycines TaxID=307491 RepID=A0A6G0U3T7_APHGL|nr:hypothetical protein AGLY_002403 [Aphis glycines]